MLIRLVEACNCGQRGLSGIGRIGDGRSGGERWPCWCAWTIRRILLSPGLTLGTWSEFWGPEVYEMSNFTTALGSRAVSMVPFQFMSLLTDSTVAAIAADRMGSWRFQNTNA